MVFKFLRDILQVRKERKEVKCLWNLYNCLLKMDQAQILISLRREGIDRAKKKEIEKLKYIDVI